MILKKCRLACFVLLATYNFASHSSAEPLIILEYSNQMQGNYGDGKNAFALNPDYFENYTVKPGDNLNSILKKFYNGSGLDWRLVQLSIVIANPKAFAKNNPNFLYSDKSLYLPGKSDITKILTGTKVGNKETNSSDYSKSKNIYFFGG